MRMDAPVFIVGTPRSGTTLTARILGRHSRLFMPGEVHFFEDVFARRKELGDPGDPGSRRAILERLLSLFGRYNEPTDQQRVDALFSDPERRDELEAACVNYRELFSAFMEIQAGSEGKVRWGNNAPRDLFSVDEILTFYPDAKIIVCVRDVRDFLVSYRDKWMATSQEEAVRLRRLYHPVITTLLWKSSMKRFLELRNTLPEARLFELRYEDLVASPEATVKRICTFLEEPFEEAMLRIESNNSSAGERRKGIFDASVGRWREGLSPEDAQIGQMLAREELAFFGYPLERLRANPAKVAGSFLSTPWRLIHALRANQVKRGPLLPYLLRRTLPFMMNPKR